MAQLVEYEAFPSTRYDQYIFKLRAVLANLEQTGNKFRPFRDHLRKQGIWDKDKSPKLFSLLDISWDKKTVTVGKTAKRLARATADDEFKNILYERLKEQNILLVKYVMEALDVESGGRLHSVHELYRMITSYVYPGEYISLTSFQAWVDWIAATGYIKLVGIRWALSPTGMKSVIELRGMDIEEILEDMEDDAGEDGEGDDDDDGDDDDFEAFADEGATAGDDDDFGFDDDEDLFSDLPSAESAAADPSFDEAFDDVPGGVPAMQPPQGRRGKRRSVGSASGAGLPMAVAAAPAHQGTHAPMAAGGWPTVATVSLEDADEAQRAARITGWHLALGEWPAFTAPSLGVEVDPKGSDLAVIVELGVLAALIEGLEPQPQVFAFVKRLRNTTFFATLGHGEGLEDCLDAMEKTGSEPWARGLFERLVHARFIARRVSAKIDILPSLKKAKDGRAVIALLREHVVGSHVVEAPFWVARELVRLGVLAGAAASECVCVPTRRLRENAARIGLVSTPELHDFEAIYALSASASALFGTAEAGYGAALEQLDRALGLTLS